MKNYLLLCGGVGGAKLALGFSKILSDSNYTIAVNTGDDFKHFNLKICPDLDTVMYTLSNESDLSKGCLLYTSPSPRDVEESRMPSSA